MGKRKPLQEMNVVPLAFFYIEYMELLQNWTIKDADNAM